MKCFLPLFLVGFFLCSCATPPPAEKSIPYTKKSDSTERKAGPSMFLYEQAEEDLDVHNVIVIPPDKKQDNKAVE